MGVGILLEQCHYRLEQSGLKWKLKKCRLNFPTKFEFMSEVNVFIKKIKLVYTGLFENVRKILIVKKI